MTDLNQATPLPLDSPRWRELRHAYGDAKDTPGLLTKYHDNPNRTWTDRDPVLDELWSSICHQGSVYTASYAAAPHLVAVAAAANPFCSLCAIQLLVAIEAGRAIAEPIPADLVASYTAAVARLPELGWRAVPATTKLQELAICCGAILAGRGFPEAAEHVFDPLGEDHFVCPHCEARLS